MRVKDPLCFATVALRFGKTTGVRLDERLPGAIVRHLEVVGSKSLDVNRQRLGDERKRRLGSAGAVERPSP